MTWWVLTCDWPELKEPGRSGAEARLSSPAETAAWMARGAAPEVGAGDTAAAGSGTAAAGAAAAARAVGVAAGVAAGATAGAAVGAGAGDGVMQDIHIGDHGRGVHVDPIKPTVKAPGAKRLSEIP